MLFTHPKRKQALLILLSGAIFSMISYALYQSGLIINITESMPQGLYWRETGTIHRGDLITFCLNSEQQKLGVKRGYLAPDSTHGNRCAIGESLLKKVIAVPGDRVILTAESITVNNIEHSYKTLSHDSKGRPLTTYPAGDYNHTSDYWVIGTSSANSWDSRYFGPIPYREILAKIKPLLIF